MELPVSIQVRELLLALWTGAAFGLLYDLLRPLRRGRWSTALTDLLYCLTVLLGLLIFTLYAGRGQLRLFTLGAMWLSGGLWLRLISPVIRRVQNRAARLLHALARRLTLPVKKLRKKSEKL